MLKQKRAKIARPISAFGDFVTGEALSSEFLNNVPNPIVVISPDTSIFFVNRAFEELTGFARRELVGKRFPYPYWPENESSITETVLMSFLASNGLSRHETTFRKKNGELFSVEMTGTPLRDSKGKLKYYLGNWVDITERKRASDALTESETKFRCLAEESPNMIFINKRGSIIYANRRCEEVTGFTKNELYASDFDFTTIIAPKFRESILESYAKHSRGEDTPALEYTLVDKTGKEIEVIMATKLVDYENEKVLMGIVTDISGQKQAEKKLRKAAQEWRTTFDSISDLVYIRNNEGKIVRLNKAFSNVFKKKPQDFLGKSCCEVVHGTPTPHRECPHRKMMETRKAVTAEYFEPTLNMYVHESISPIVDEQGRITGTVNVIRDISEHKRIEEQLIMTDRLATVGELAAGIAHELNNPLTGVIGFSQLILEGPVPDQMRDDLNIIANEAQRAAKIVKNLLTFARKHEPVKQLNQVNDCISEVLNIRAYEQKNRNIKVVTDLNPDLPKIMIDYFQMQQVFINLIINAEFFMFEFHNGGTLSISTQQGGGLIRASFSDDGPGIAQEALKHLFSPFFTTKEVGKGTGLGLAICHGIVSEHGGKIYVDSKAGSGATFVVELPVNAA